MVRRGTFYWFSQLGEPLTEFLDRNGGVRSNLNLCCERSPSISPLMGFNHRSHPLIPVMDFVQLARWPLPLQL